MPLPLIDHIHFHWVHAPTQKVSSHNWQNSLGSISYLIYFLEWKISYFSRWPPSLASVHKNYSDIFYQISYHDLNIDNVIALYDGFVADYLPLWNYCSEIFISWSVTEDIWFTFRIRLQDACSRINLNEEILEFILIGAINFLFGVQELWTIGKVCNKAIRCFKLRSLSTVFIDF